MPARSPGEVGWKKIQGDRKRRKKEIRNGLFEYVAEECSWKCFMYWGCIMTRGEKRRRGGGVVLMRVFFGFLTFFEEGTDMLCRNVGNKLPILAA
jgi:hypothetical protein